MLFPVYAFLRASILDFIARLGNRCKETLGNSLFRASILDFRARLGNRCKETLGNSLIRALILDFRARLGNRCSTIVVAVDNGPPAAQSWGAGRDRVPRRRHKPKLKAAGVVPVPVWVPHQSQLSAPGEKLLQEHPDHLQLGLCVWLIAEREVYPAFLVGDALQMGESVETVFAVVVAHTAFAYATERHIVGSQVNDGVVHAAAAEVQSLQEIIPDSRVIGEYVARERARAGVDVLYDVVEIGVTDDRKEGAENFVLHNLQLFKGRASGPGPSPGPSLSPGISPGISSGFGIGGGEVAGHHYGRGDAEALILLHSTGQNGLISQLAAAVIQDIAEAVIMLAADNLAIVFILKRILAVHSPHLLLAEFQETGCDTLVYENVVRSDAGLAKVEILAEHNPGGGDLEVGLLIHNHRTLASKFKGDRGEVDGCLAHDHPAHSLAAGEEDIVPFLFKQVGIHVAATFYDGHIIFSECILYQPFDGSAGGRCVGGRLYHRGIAGCQSADERGDTEQERIVPRAHYQHIAVWLPEYVARGVEVGQRRADPALASPAHHVADGVADFGKDETVLAHIRFGLALAQVFLKGCKYVVLMIYDTGTQQLEQSLAVSYIQCVSFVEESSLSFEYLHRISDYLLYFSLCSLISSSSTPGSK